MYEARTKGTPRKYSHPIPRHERRATGITFRQQKRRRTANRRAHKADAEVLIYGSRGQRTQRVVLRGKSTQQEVIQWLDSSNY